jgi:DNA-binding NarL/FixJ family response regulator
MAFDEERDVVRAYLCDDVPSLRKLVRLVLEEDPAVRVVGEAGDAPTAISEIGELQPNVVLLDLSMPGMDGLEALPLIREAAPEVCVIVFSGFTVERMAAVARAHGADHYVTKGEELDALRDMVRDCKAIAA